MKSLSLLLVAASIFAVSCERHDFDGPDGTKHLQDHHGAAAHEEKAGEHAEAPAHEEKAEH